MSERIESFHADWIKETELTDRPGVHITGEYTRPFVTGRDHLPALAVTMAVVMIWFFFHPSDAGMAERIGGGILAGGLIYVVVVAFPFVGLMNLIPRNVDVRVLPEAIQIGQGSGHATYARGAPIEFRVEPHRHAAWEEAQERKRGRPGHRTYREAIEVVLQYGERRISIAEMRMIDMEMAKALVIRLHGWNAGFEQALERLGERQSGPEEALRKPSGSGDFGPEPELR